MWKYVNMKDICVQDVLVLWFLYLNWRSNLVDKDSQQDPPSLPFARPRAKAKALVVDQELLQCRLYFKNYHVYNKAFFLDSNKSPFYPPFFLDSCGAYCFSKS